MACQMNPNLYCVTSRCPMEDAARLKQLADAEGVTMSCFVAKMIAEKVAGVEIQEYLKEWMAEQLERNMEHRKYQDEKTASGYYRVKRPKKRGRPPKAKKRGRPPKKIRKTRSDKGIPRGPKVAAEVVCGSNA